MWIPIKAVLLEHWTKINVMLKTYELNSKYNSFGKINVFKNNQTFSISIYDFFKVNLFGLIFTQ